MRPRDVKRLFGFPSRSGDDVRDEVEEEFRFHLDMRVDELTRTGLDPAAARVQALAEFGDPQPGVTACAVHGERLERQRRAARLAGELRQDTTVALRQLAAGPGFAIVSILHPRPRDWRHRRNLQCARCGAAAVAAVPGR